MSDDPVPVAAQWPTSPGPAPIAGPYLPPRYEVGGPLFCEMRGWVTVGGMTDAPVPWPYMKARGRHSPILCGDLVRAVRQEANAVVCFLFGVTGQTVTKWRKALGVPHVTPGTSEMKSAPKRGVPRPPHVHAKLREAQARRRTARRSGGGVGDEGTS